MSENERLIIVTIIQGFAIVWWLSDHHNSTYLWGMWFGFWTYSFFQNVGKILNPED